MKPAIFIVEKTDTGFSAYAKDYPIFTTGCTMDELKQNIQDALDSWTEPKNSPKAKPDSIKIQIDLQQLFEYYNELNAKALSKRMGMNETLLSQYVTGKKVPSAKQTQRILKGVNELGRELAGLQLSI